MGQHAGLGRNGLEAGEIDTGTPHHYSVVPLIIAAKLGKVFKSHPSHPSRFRREHPHQLFAVRNRYVGVPDPNLVTRIKFPRAVDAHAVDPCAIVCSEVFNGYGAIVVSDETGVAG